MDLSFGSKKLQRELESAKAMQKAYGQRAAKIKLRLDLLAESTNLADVPSTPPPRCHLLSGDYSGCFAVDIGGNWRLVFKPNHDPVPKLDDGGIDLKKVTAICVLEIVDYHG
jgi:toxin HigB-1